MAHVRRHSLEQKLKVMWKQTHKNHAEDISPYIFQNNKSIWDTISKLETKVQTHSV
jgi:hypothetical protein